MDRAVGVSMIFFRCVHEEHMGGVTGNSNFSHGDLPSR